MILAQVPYDSYGYLSNGVHFKLARSAINVNRVSVFEGLLTVILWPGTPAARLEEFPASLPIRELLRTAKV